MNSPPIAVTQCDKNKTPDKNNSPLFLSLQNSLNGTEIKRKGVLTRKTNSHMLQLEKEKGSN